MASGSVWMNGVKYVYPVCYEELKTRQYQRIVKEWEIDKPTTDRDYFKLFCILTDTDFKAFHPTAENEVTIWNTVAWFRDEYINMIEERPKVLQIGDAIIDIPINIRELSIGQNIHTRQAIESSKYLGEAISIATAIYLQPLLDKSKFDYNKALELDKTIQEMPAYLIKPIGFFLLSRANRYGMMQENYLKKILLNLKENLKRTFLTWPSGKGLRPMQT